MASGFGGGFGGADFPSEHVPTFEPDTDVVAVGPPHDDQPDLSRSQMFWLPPHTFGNGIGAEAWAELADLSEGELAGVLFAFAEARIGANVALPRASSRDERSRYRLWVDTRQYRRAEDLLMEVLAELRHLRQLDDG